MSYFVVHRRLSPLDCIDIKDEIDEVLDMAWVDDMDLKSTFTYTDQSHVQHLYLIFKQNSGSLQEERNIHERKKQMEKARRRKSGSS